MKLFKIYKMRSSLLSAYNTGWSLLLPLLRLNPRLRDGYNSRTLKGQPPMPADLWIQAASAGEAYLADSILKSLPRNRKLRILVTTNTRQGMEILEKGFSDLQQDGRAHSIETSFFPFDKPSIMEAAAGCIDPKVMVLLETELWPGLLSCLRRKGCRILVVNGRMTPGSLRRYKIVPGFWKQLAPDRILAVSGDDARRFGDLFGDEAVEVMPNIKFDRLQADMEQGSGENPIDAFLPEESGFLLLGSVRQEEEQYVRKIIEKVTARFPGLVTGIFPRHMHRVRAWKQYLEKNSRKWLLRSCLPASGAEPGSIVLWDSFGELKDAYSRASAVFVGGSLAPLGGQNFIEPLMHGRVPVIGPYWENFSWVGEGIIEKGLVRRAENWQQAADLLIKLMEAPPSKNGIQQKAASYFRKNQGGTRQAVQLISEMLDSGTEKREQ